MCMREIDVVRYHTSTLCIRMQPEGDRLGGRRLLLLRSKCYTRLSIQVDQSAKKLVNTQSRQLPWSCFQHAVTNSLLRAREASCACVCLVNCLFEVLLPIQRFAGWLAQICDENSRMRGIFNSKFPPKVCACADFRRKFVPTNLQTSVCRKFVPTNLQVAQPAGTLIL